MAEYGTMRVKSGLAEMLKGGVIMDVVDAEQAKIAEEAGACAVMALERVPADIRRDGGVARMSDPEMISGIQEAVSIPVMAKARIGHFVEAQVLEALEVDYIDESEVLTPAASPMIFTGLRLSLQASWTTLVAAELIGALFGLGRVLNLAQQDIYPGMILVGMATVALCGWGTTVLLGAVERRALAWNLAAQRQAA